MNIFKMATKKEQPASNITTESQKIASGLMKNIYCIIAAACVFAVALTAMYIYSMATYQSPAVQSCVAGHVKLV